MMRAMTKSIRMFVLATSGIAFLMGALPMAATAISSAQRYTDLRQIDPIHGNAAAGAQKATACHACHGANGVSIEPTFPRLAGQRADYLYHRLVSFKQADPKDPYYSKTPMTALAAHLSDDDMRDLASYFAAQIPQATDAAAAAIASGRGEFLYRSGDPSNGVPPCQGCHGAEAQGVNGPGGQYTAYPALRGQYGPYLIARLKSFRQGLPRNSSNDLLMSGVARTLDDDAIQAVAAWLSSLTPTRSL
jgi:cytochrome c553